MLDPGAKMSTQLPVLLKYERASDEVVAPTVIAAGAEAGEYEHASSSSFPAATTTVMPALRIAVTAALSDVEKLPPIDIDATHGRELDAQCSMTFSQPSMMPDHEPLPVSLSTFTP